MKLLALSLILTVVVTAFAKILFSQPRPFLVLEHVNVLTSSIDPNSFPSGHTATTLSTMTVLFLSAKRYFTRYNLIR
ncbi:phosphatase PAP2 family protein, partial [Methanobrevibacter sp.]|uniref:phosphatase PAP2 family protein n=1 Tax=Methanobrevibacter sp. TaxID=66852 RepID=UPI00386FE4C6